MSTTTLAVTAAVVAAAAVWVASGSRAAHARLGTAVPGRPGTSGAASPHQARDPARPLPAAELVVVGVAAGLGVVVVVGGRPLALLLPLALAVLVVRRGMRSASRHRDEARRRQACIELVDALASELRAGRHPPAALHTVVRDGRPGLLVLDPQVLGRWDADVPAALRAAASQPGAGALLWLATCWAVSERHGSGLAPAADRIRRTLLAQSEIDEEVRSELASARATARLLAVLPLVGVGFGHVLGADVLRVLLGSSAGAALLTGGVALAALGLAWVDRLAAGPASARR